MAALGLALFTISSPATGHPAPPPWPTAGFHDVFALAIGPPGGAAGSPVGRSQRSQPQMNSRGDLDDS
jgi:hypothetical protein